MLPGKSYSVEDILHILRRRYWLLVLPMALLGAAAAQQARSLPDVYRSETLIQVMPQRIPTNYVQPTVTTRIEDRLGSITTTIMSRSRLERIVNEFDLYPEARRSMPMEDVVRAMRERDVIVEPVIRGESFRVAFSGRDPVQVMKVTDSLADLFIEETLRDRQNLAEGTSQFLESELADAKAKLIEHERRLEAYRLRFAGQLPTEMQANLQQVSNNQMALQNLRDSMSADRQRKLELERQVGDLQMLLAADASAALNDSVAAAATAAASGTTAQQLMGARQALAVLEQQGKKRGHPDVEAAERRIRELQARLQGEAALPPTAVGVTTPEAMRPRRLSDLKSQIAELDSQLRSKQDEERRLLAVGTDLQRRIDAVPTRESELTELMRDYNILKGSYEALLNNQQQSRIAANLERRQIGEQFRRLDPARLPEVPVSPDRPQITLVGMAAGFVIGAVVLVLLEYRDSTLRTDRDVAAVLQLPVLAVVPLMRSDADVRRDTWRRLAMTTGLAGIVLSCLGYALNTLVR